MRWYCATVRPSTWLGRPAGGLIFLSPGSECESVGGWSPSLAQISGTRESGGLTLLAGNLYRLGLRRHIGGPPMRYQRRKKEGGLGEDGGRRSGGLIYLISIPPSLSLHPPLPIPLSRSMTMLRRQLLSLPADDVGLIQGAPATQKSRFGQNRERGGDKRRWSHRAPGVIKREGWEN